MIKAAFLDRDGVINVDKGYIYKWEDFEFIDGTIEGLKLLINEGYSIIIITNQSGMARGIFEIEEYLLLTKQYLNYLNSKGVFIRHVYYCPHLQGGKIKKYNKFCNCRKPLPGMILNAVRDYKISLKESILFGDKETDVLAGFNAGIDKSFLIGQNIEVDNNFINLLSAVKSIFKI